MTIDPKKTAQSLVRFLKNTFLSTGFSRCAIALSGGVDSSTSCFISVKALGKENVFPVFMPYGSLNTQGTVDAFKITEFLGIPEKNIVKVDIRPLVDPIIALNPAMDVLRKGNIMARMRMIILFDQAKKHNGLVVGTENKSERLLSYFTRFGDEASDIEPLGNLYKTQVYQLAEYLGIPESILTKKPTAGLWEGQTDEGEFGFTYKEADKILYFLYDQKKTVEEVIKEGFDSSTVEKVKDWVEKNDFKHHLPKLPTAREVFYQK